MNHFPLAVSNPRLAVGLIIGGAALFFPVACMTAQASPANENKHSVVPNYVKDYRTNLCFAVWYDMGTDSRSITEVPCSYLIRRLIENDDK